MFNAPSKKGGDRLSTQTICCHLQVLWRYRIRLKWAGLHNSHSRWVVRSSSTVSKSFKKVQMEKGNETMQSNKKIKIEIVLGRGGVVGGWDNGTFSTGFDGTDDSMQRPLPLIGWARRLLHPPLVALNKQWRRLLVPIGSVLPLFITTTAIVWSGY